MDTSHGLPSPLDNNRLDRLVDGELDEPTPPGTARHARSGAGRLAARRMTFLEAQCWKEGLGAMGRTAADGPAPPV